MCALRRGHVRSNAMPKTGVCEQKLLTSVSPAGIPRAHQLCLSRKVPVRTGSPVCLGTHEKLRHSHLKCDARQFAVPVSEHQWPLSRKAGKGAHFHSETAARTHSLDCRAGSGSHLQTLPRGQHNAKAQSQLNSDLGSGPDLTPLERTSNDWELGDAQIRGNLFESPRHLEELALPEETKRFVRVLESPHKGSLVYLIGTAHVSKASMDDVRLLIEAVKPDVVAVELDREGLNLMERDRMAASSEVSLHTTWEALSVVQRSYSGHFEKLWSAYQPHIESQALGITYGCDARSAIQTARRLGARIEPIDQSIATITSSLEEFDHAQFHDRARTTLSGFVRVPQSMELMLQLLNPFRKFDGEDGADAQNEVAAFRRISAAFLSGKPAPLDDIAVFQSLKNKALEATRLDCFKGEVVPAFDEEEGPNVYSALLHERDRLMGLKLAALARRRRKKVVAVVGAAHVPGITTRFAQYTAGYVTPFDGSWEGLGFAMQIRLDRERKERQSYARERHLQSALEDSEVGGLADYLEVLCRGLLFATLAGIGAFAWGKWPMLTAELLTGAFTAHGLLILGLAAFTAKWAQFGEYLEAASLELHRKQYPECL